MAETLGCRNLLKGLLTTKVLSIFPERRCQGAQDIVRYAREAPRQTWQAIERGLDDGAVDRRSVGEGGQAGDP